MTNQDKDGTDAKRNIDLTQIEKKRIIITIVGLMTDFGFYVNYNYKITLPTETSQHGFNRKLTPKTFRRETEALLQASTKLQCNKLTLVAFSETRDETVQGHSIHIFSAIDWLLKMK